MLFEVEPNRRSALTPGGSPASDAQYLAWRRGFVEAVNARWLDRHTRFGHDLPDREPLDGPRLDEWLFLKTGGSRLLDDFNYSHRLRHLSVAFATRHTNVVRMARQYAARRLHLTEGHR